MKNPRSFLAVFSALAVFATALAAQTAQPNHLGVFSGSDNIGAAANGMTAFDPAISNYKVTGNGADIGGRSDNFHLDWVRLPGDASISADVQLPEGSASPHAQAVLMFRQSLEPGSAYADISIQADGRIALQYRTPAGAEAAGIAAPQQKTGRISIRRQGNEFVAAAMSPDGKMVPFAHYTVPMTDPVYIGAGVCSHDAAKPSTVTFSNLSIERYAY